MASIEKRVVSAVLTKIRTRRGESSVANGDSRVRPAAAVAPARLREALFSDFSAVAELKRRWGLAPDSIENWERLWHHNPALAHTQFERPIGWVLEAEGRVVGYLGNISLLYRYGDRTLTAVTAHGFVVEPPYRAVGVSLVAAFFRQKHVDLYVSTTAIEAVGKIARAFKADPLPQADYETVLFWVLRPYPFAEGFMKKLGLKSPLSRIGSVLASLAVATDKVLRRRWPKRVSTNLAVTEISVSEIGDDFEKLWMHKVNEKPRLLADRSSGTLRWHFDIPGDRDSVQVLCCSKNGELLGYAIIRNESPDVANGLRKSIVADMLAKEDDTAVLEVLLIAAHSHAKHAGSDILEVLGFPQSVRRVCSQWHPYLRRYPSCPYHYKAADPILHRTLSDGAAWYASPFDGDATLIRPSYSSPDGLSGAQIEGNGNNATCDVTEGQRPSLF